VKTVNQCATCPWRVGIKPSRDVPDFDPGIYDRMRSSLREGVASMAEKKRIVMECHNGKRGANRPCAGWLHHQLGVGNNLGVRLAVITERMPTPKVFGEQHEDLEGLEE
jgi:hypothetical protein